MKVIKGHVGKKKGETGVTVHIYSQGKKPIYSKSLTIHGMDVDLIYSYIKFWFNVLSSTKDIKHLNIEIDSEKE